MSTIFQPPPSNLTTIASIMTSEIQTGKASIQWMSPEHEKSLLSNFLLLSFCLPAAASVNLTFGLFYLSHQHRWPAPDRKLFPSNGKETTIFLALTNQSCQNTVSWTSWNRVHTLWKWRKFECSFAVYNLPPYCAIPFWGDLENLRMQSAHLSPGIEILTSLNFECQLQIVCTLYTVIWLIIVLRFIMWQWLLKTWSFCVIKISRLHYQMSKPLVWGAWSREVSVGPWVSGVWARQRHAPPRPCFELLTRRSTPVYSATAHTQCRDRCPA